jgi:hypothetical protein
VPESGAEAVGGRPGPLAGHRISLADPKSGDLLPKTPEDPAEYFRG